MSEKGPDDLNDFPKIDFEKKSFRKLRTCKKCNIPIIVREYLDYWQGKLLVFATCPWCSGPVYKREKEDGDEWLALSN